MNPGTHPHLRKARGSAAPSLVVLCAAVLCLSQPLPAQVNTGACAAFSRAGDVATATVSGRELKLELREAQDTPKAVAATLAAAADRCSAAFSADGKYLAIQVQNSLAKEQPVEIAIWDTREEHWLSEKPFVPQLPEGFRGTLQGFLEDSAKMVLADSGTYFDDRNRTSLFPMILEIDARARTLVTRNDARAFPGIPLERWNGVVDARANRLWYRGDLAGCGFQSVTLVGKWQRGPVLDEKKLREAGCTVPEVIVPGQEAVILGSARNSAIALWKVATASGVVEGLDLPVAPKERLVLGKGTAVSPDGTLIALRVMRYSEPMPSVLRGPQHEIVVVQLKPFRVVGIVKTTAVPTAPAVGSRNGAASVLAFRDGKWMEQRVSGGDFPPRQ